jgi:outer membrane protein insertion porin family
MNAFKKSLGKILLIISFVFLVSTALAANRFTIQNIKIEGLQRISKTTAFSYLPVKAGETYTSTLGNQIIESLYNTGFFSDVQLFRRLDTLVIRVQERPTIGLISIKGNRAVSTKELKKVLLKMGIVEGDVFDESKLHEIVEGLRQEYGLLGRYSAQVGATVKKEPRNRVAIYITINEGVLTKVKKVIFIGNHAFSESELRDHFSLTTIGLFTFFTHADLFSEIKLEKAIEGLHTFYLNRGYLKFRVISSRTVMTPDRSGVYIYIDLYEGPLYRISGFKVVGSGVKHRAEIEHLIGLRPGEVFSERRIRAINKAIASEYADRGYAFPDIQMIPTLNDVNHTVFLTFNIQKGHIVYVHHINFIGNHRTEDNVLRFQTRQMEGAKYDYRRIMESKRRLANLPFLTNITVVPTPVPGYPDEADLNYHVKEINAGKISVQGGWAEDYGFLYGASISEPNFMGTGRFVALSFQRSDYSTSYNFAYNNPFYTIYGMSRGFNIYLTQSNGSNRRNINLEDSYNMNDFGGQIFYGVPITQYTTFDFGFGYDYIDIFGVNVQTYSPNVRVFLENFGFNPRHSTSEGFHQFSGNFGFDRVTLNRAVFPTDGSVQKLIVTAGAPITSESPGFAKVTYVGQWYFPLGHGFVINPHTQLGYGVGFGKSGLLPFWQNFYAGGINTLPGFEPNTLGPKSFLPGAKNAPVINNSVAMGGNVELLGGVDFIFPNFISDKVRTAAIVDAGNIFQTEHYQYSQAQFDVNPGLRPIDYEDVSFHNLRLSAGLLVSWYSPLGLINFTVAYPIVKKSGDHTEIFGFSFGTSV